MCVFVCVCECNLCVYTSLTLKCILVRYLIARSGLGKKKTFAYFISYFFSTKLKRKHKTINEMLRIKIKEEEKKKTFDTKKYGLKQKRS